eukprot:365658-Chlamydomonas_euryale.AAC.12
MCPSWKLLNPGREAARIREQTQRSKGRPSPTSPELTTPPPPTHRHPSHSTPLLLDVGSIPYVFFMRVSAASMSVHRGGTQSPYPRSSTANVTSSG